MINTLLESTQTRKNENNFDGKNKRIIRVCVLDIRKHKISHFIKTLLKKTMKFI